MATSLKLDDVTKGRIERLALLRDRTPHWIMRQAIAEYVDREEARESFRQEAHDSWTHWRETGEHLTGDEVLTWLNSWGRDGETEAPPCHD